jgi:hypothetical protein
MERPGRAETISAITVIQEGIRATAFFGRPNAAVCPVKPPRITPISRGDAGGITGIKICSGFEHDVGDLTINGVITIQRGGVLNFFGNVEIADGSMIVIEDGGIFNMDTITVNGPRTLELADLLCFSRIIESDEIVFVGDVLSGFS